MICLEYLIMYYSLQFCGHEKNSLSLAVVGFFKSRSSKNTAYCRSKFIRIESGSQDVGNELVIASIFHATHCSRIPYSQHRLCRCHFHSPHNCKQNKKRSEHFCLNITAVSRFSARIPGADRPIGLRQIGPFVEKIIMLR